MRESGQLLPRHWNLSASPTNDDDRATICGLVASGELSAKTSGSCARRTARSVTRLPVRQHPHQRLPLFDGHGSASDEGLQPRHGDAGEKRDLIQGPTAADAGEFELCNLPVAVVWRHRGQECHGPRYGVECSAGVADDDVAALRESPPLADSCGVAADG